MTTENPFNILNNNINNGVKEFKAQNLQGANLTARIEEIINSDQIVIFMKGNTDFPQCGFSANTTAIFKHLGQNFTTFDILTDMEIRQGLKEYSNWPTFPQVFWKGKLIGGNDIITEMFENGDLQELLESK
jgi:monothiol glutaredoxin